MNKDKPLYITMLVLLAIIQVFSMFVLLESSETNTQYIKENVAKEIEYTINHTKLECADYDSNVINTECYEKSVIAARSAVESAPGVIKVVSEKEMRRTYYNTCVRELMAKHCAQYKLKFQKY